MRILSFYCIVSMFIISPVHCFTTLDDIVAYAKFHPEYPQPDNDNPSEPDYRSYYRSKAPTYWGSLLEKLGLRTTLYTKFYRDLKEMVAFHLKQRLLTRYTFALQVQPGTQFIILSNVRGELHSLARILSALHKNGIIDKHLKLNPDLFLIANGNMLAISADPIETLEIILRIMQENPLRIFYIKGFYEDKERWLLRPLGYQLDIVFHGDLQVIELIRTFFNTLSLGLYILSDDLHEPPIRVSYYDTIKGEFEYLSCRRDQPFTETFKKAVCFLNRTHPAPQGPLTALIAGTDTGINFDIMKGLFFIPGNPPLWKCLSSPAHHYRHSSGYAYDSFVVLTIGKSVKDSTLTLFNQNVYKPGFKLEGTYNIVTGKLVTVPGIQPSEVWSSILEKLRSFAKGTQSTKETVGKMNAHNTSKIEVAGKS
jgi:hypothetical protein